MNPAELFSTCNGLIEFCVETPRRIQLSTKLISNKTQHMMLDRFWDSAGRFRKDLRKAQNKRIMYEIDNSSLIKGDC